MSKRIRVLRAEDSKHYSAPELAFTLDAKATARRIGKAVKERHQEAIRAGRRPSGGAQKGLGPDEQSRAGEGKRSAKRGMGQEGRFPASIGTRAKGGDVRATAVVAADPFFDEWQRREASRGVEYLETDGDIEKLVDDVLEAELRRQGFK